MEEVPLKNKAYVENVLLIIQCQNSNFELYDVLLETNKGRIFYFCFITDFVLLVSLTLLVDSNKLRNES